MSAYAQIEHTEASGQDVTLFTRAPWVSLPTRFIDQGTCSFMFSPTWLGSLATRVEAVVDPDIAVLLRVACFAGGDRPFLCFEMRDLVAGAPDAGAFEQ